MLRYKLQELLAEKAFTQGQRVTLSEVAKTTKINRMTLSKLVNRRGYGTTTVVLDKLCAYFDCRIEDLVEYIPDSKVPAKVSGNPPHQTGNTDE